ncbi:MAG: ATP-dependent helicase HrpB [Gammaproteobacteria bacterium]|nr:ATP-dependent helicase HrpB [Gammaproteobacteria bacterium]
MSSSPLPINALLPDIQSVLREHTRLILHAPPGAGKSTRVPLALLNEPWVAQRKIIVLEPRRLAAKSIAQRLAHNLGEAVGHTVGYRMRLESKISQHTRIEVVTEGVLTRLLQTDAALQNVAAVIFDEFHERNLNADLALALCLDAQTLVREDLRLVLMSATLDGAALAQWFKAPLIISPGRQYPIVTHYRPIAARYSRERRAFLEAVAQTTLKAIQENNGSVLVFLPGEADIRQLAQLLASRVDNDTAITPLYGNLDYAAQQRAIQPAPLGQRKIVLATNIAETSLTIEDVCIVIDSGLARAPRFNPNQGMAQLETIFISQANADQRAGRAGRTQPGVCYRLWAEPTILNAHAEAEILQTDLASFALELAQWGTQNIKELQWLDEPPTAHLNQAQTLLRNLGALNDLLRVTEHGKKILTLATHPRLAHMILRGIDLNAGALACTLAALLSERDIFIANSSDKSNDKPADIQLRLDAINELGANTQPIHNETLRRIQEQARRWMQQFNIAPNSSHAANNLIGVLIACAYPDRIAQQRPGQNARYLLSNGRGAELTAHDNLNQHPYLACAHIDGAANGKIFLAAKLDERDIDAHFNANITQQALLYWDKNTQSIIAKQQRRLGDIILKENASKTIDTAALNAAYVTGIANEGIGCLPWDARMRQWQARVQLMHNLQPDAWPNVSDDYLQRHITHWLAPFTNGFIRLNQITSDILWQALQQHLTWPQSSALDQQAPTHITVPSGSRIAIDYGQTPPVLAVRLQELFGLQDTPRIANNTITLMLHLLSPARRPVQITQDLANFWKSTYAEVKKDLKGRYPKHEWPDNPLLATATARAKPRGK